jgi:ElaB/YqjD/DUF883 family membrane-anchored ribosome-binding protein
MSTNSNSQSSNARTKNESAPTSKRVSALAHESIDKASDKAEVVEKKLRSEADRIAQKSSETAADARKKLDDTVNSVEGFVRERPFAAAGIAFAAGVLGALLIRK